MDCRTFASSIKNSTPETKRLNCRRSCNYLALQSFPLLLQGTSPRYFRFCGADCFRPCWWFFRWRRLPLPSDRWHQRQHLCRHYRAALDGLHSHWVDGCWFAFRHATVTVSGSGQDRCAQCTSLLAFGARFGAMFRAEYPSKAQIFGASSARSNTGVFSILP
jgi:hypothetical protein